MAYNNTINNLKTALASYSEDEKKLNELYKNALSNLSNQHTNAKNEIETQYRADRNQAYSDTAREERNTLNTLAARGLGFSGETAQAKLNSGIILGNRFSELASKKNSNMKDIELQFADKKNELAFDQAAKISDYHDRRNKLNAEIAGMELQKEQDDAKLAQEKYLAESSLAAEMERHQNELSQRDKELQWEKENASSNRDAERAKYEAELRAQMERLQAELSQRDKEFQWEKMNDVSNRAAEKAKYEAQIKADMEKLQAELAMKQQELQWEKENASSNRDAEKTKYEAELRAQMERLQAELSQRDKEFQWEKENAVANRDADKAKYEAQIKADMEKLQAELEMKNKELIQQQLENSAERSAEKDKYQAQIKADMEQLQAELEMKQQELQWAKEKSASELAAKQEEYEAEIRAKKELELLGWEMKKQMLDAELNAKKTQNGNSSSNNSSGNSSNKNQSTENKGYAPSITAKDLGKQLVSSASGGKTSLNGDKQMYYVNKYLLDLSENYDLNEDYLNDLLLVLKSYGYTSSSTDDMKVQVISYDAKEHYEKIYGEQYNKLIVQGADERTAKTSAKDVAIEKQLDYIYASAQDESEFKKCCQKLGIPQGNVDRYLKILRLSSSGGNMSGGGKGMNTTVNMLK